MVSNEEIPAKKSYSPCRIAGTVMARTYREMRYRGYKYAKELKYEAIPHQTA